MMMMIAMIWSPWKYNEADIAPDTEMSRRLLCPAVGHTHVQKTLKFKAEL